MKGLLSIIIFILVVSQVLSEFQRQTWGRCNADKGTKISSEKNEAGHEVPFPLLFMGFNKREVLFHHSAEPSPGGQRWVWCRVKPSLAIAV